MSAVDRAVDTNNDREMRTVLEPLARLADDTSCTVVGHFNKSASADPLNLLMGSRAFAVVVRAVLAFALTWFLKDLPLRGHADLIRERIDGVTGD
jgi:hypothetical protein